MRRREFGIAASASALLLCVRAARAQARPVLIGWLNPGSSETSGPFLVALREGLAAHGWKEGFQYVVAERWAGGRMGQLPALAEQLAAMKPAIIVAMSSPAVTAATKAAPTTPIVQASGADPVLTGLVKSLAKPGGMITGLSNIVGDTTEKLLELLLAMAPKTRRVGFLFGPETRGRPAVIEAARRSVAQYSGEAVFVEALTPEEVGPALARLAKHGIQALIAATSPLLFTERRTVIKFATAQRWPMISWTREWAEDGALLSYGIDTAANFRRAAYFVDRILKGTKPGDLPIEQPTRIELVLNKKTASALGLTIPQTVLLQADRVIE